MNQNKKFIENNLKRKIINKLKHDKNNTKPIKDVEKIKSSYVSIDRVYKNNLKSSYSLEHIKEFNWAEIIIQGSIYKNGKYIKDSNIPFYCNIDRFSYKKTYYIYTKNDTHSIVVELVGDCIVYDNIKIKINNINEVKDYIEFKYVSCAYFD